MVSKGALTLNLRLPVDLGATLFIKLGSQLALGRPSGLQMGPMVSRGKTMVSECVPFVLDLEPI